MALAQLRFKHAREGSTLPLTAQLSAEDGHGAIGPEGISPKSGFPVGLIDASGNLVMPDGGPYLINPASVGEGLYRLSVLSGRTIISSVTFLPRLTGEGVVDVNALLTAHRAVTSTPEQIGRLNDGLAALADYALDGTLRKAVEELPGAAERVRQVEITLGTLQEAQQLRVDVDVARVEVDTGRAAALAAETAARAAQGVAEGEASRAAQAARDALTYRDEAGSARTGAQGSAAAASQSASHAESSAEQADLNASAATASRVRAETAAGEARGSAGASAERASAAASSATAAGNSASAAEQSAVRAGSSAGQAAGSAGAAAESSARAETASTQAQQSAASARTERLAAETSAGQAGGSATQAGQSAAAAGSSAAAAYDAATQAGSYSTAAQSAAAATRQDALTARSALGSTVTLTGNPDFRYGLTGWTETANGPEGAALLLNTSDIVIVPDVTAPGGQFLRVTHTHVLYSARIHRLDPQRRYRVMVRYRQSTRLSSEEGRGRFVVGLWTLKGDYGPGRYLYKHLDPNPASPDWKTAVLHYGLGTGDVFGPDEAFFRLRAEVNYATDAADVTDIALLSVEDVTESWLAGEAAGRADSAAQASAGSASQAASNATAAGNSAAAAQQSAVQAQSSFGQADAARQAAEGSANQSGGSAAEARGSAAAAAGSASVAQTAANAAGNSADAARQSAVSASSAFDGAVMARQAAEGSAGAAGQQAAQAGQQAERARGSADAAASSAVQASTKAGEAGQSAVAAQQSATEARTARQGAEGAAQNAAASVTRAESARSSSEEAAHAAIALSRNPYFAQGATGWIADVSGSRSALPEVRLPDSAVIPHLNPEFAPSGYALQRTGHTDTFSELPVEIADGRVYRITATTWVASPASAGFGGQALGVALFRPGGATTLSGGWNHPRDYVLPWFRRTSDGAGRRQDFSLLVSRLPGYDLQLPAEAASFRPMLALNMETDQAPDTRQMVTHVSRFLVEDVTGEVRAASSASAAQQSELRAKTAYEGAAHAREAAEGARDAAGGQAGAARSSAEAAAGSASQAQSSAGEAQSHAQSAQSSANRAEANFTAAEGSRQRAEESAGAAAGSAEQARGEAGAARSSASAAATSAAQAEGSAAAAGSSAAAAQQSSLAAGAARQEAQGAAQNAQASLTQTAQVGAQTQEVLHQAIAQNRNPYFAQGAAGWIGNGPDAANPAHRLPDSLITAHYNPEFAPSGKALERRGHSDTLSELPIPIGQDRVYRLYVTTWVSSPPEAGFGKTAFGLALYREDGRTTVGGGWTYERDYIIPWSKQTSDGDRRADFDVLVSRQPGYDYRLPPEAASFRPLVVVNMGMGEAVATHITRILVEDITERVRAGSSAAAAEQSRLAAQAAYDGASGARQGAEGAREAARGSAEAAAGSASQASSRANDALSHAQAAQGSALEARSSFAAAEQARRGAEGAAGAAEGSAGAAGTSAAAARESAAQASSSASAAAGSAQSAENSRLGAVSAYGAAGEEARRAGSSAEAARDSAAVAATQASAARSSAEAAESSRLSAVSAHSAAAEQAQQAGSSANLAGQRAAEAGGQAGIAGQKAGEAGGYAQTASEKAAQAGKSAEDAGRSAGAAQSQAQAAAESARVASSSADAARAQASAAQSSSVSAQASFAAAQQARLEAGGAAQDANHAFENAQQEAQAARLRAEEAGQHAGAAGQRAAEAGQGAAEAGRQASLAGGSASLAGQHASAAGQKAEEARQQAGAAVQKASEASASASAAQQSAQAADQSRVLAQTAQSVALTYRDEAAQSRDQAAEARSQAGTFAANAGGSASTAQNAASRADASARTAFTSMQAAVVGRPRSLSQKWTLDFGDAATRAKVTVQNGQKDESVNWALGVVNSTNDTFVEINGLDLNPWDSWVMRVLLYVESDSPLKPDLTLHYANKNHGWHHGYAFRALNEDNSAISDLPRHRWIEVEFNADWGRVEEQPHDYGASNWHGLRFDLSGTPLAGRVYIQRISGFARGEPVASKAEFRQLADEYHAETTIKVQSGNVIAGIGARASADGGSEVGVLADRFFVSSPSAPNKKPFQVVNGDIKVGGDLLIPGSVKVGALDLGGRTDSLYVRGTGLNRNMPRIVRLNGADVAASEGRGLHLLAYQASTMTLWHNRHYDVYGSQDERNALADELDRRGADQLLILSSYDAINIDERLAAAINNAGGNVKPCIGRIPYALVTLGYSRKGGGLQQITDEDGAAAPAEITTLLVDGRPVSMGAGLTNQTLIEGGQIRTGSVTADKLAAQYVTVGTPIGSLPGNLDTGRLSGNLDQGRINGLPDALADAKRAGTDAAGALEQYKQAAGQQFVSVSTRNADVDALSRSIQGTNDRIGSEAGRLDGRVNDVSGNLNNQVSRLDGRVNDTNQNVNNQVGRLDGRINDTAGYIDRVNGSIEQVKTNIYYPGTTVIDGGKIMTGSIQVGGNLLKNPSFQNDLWGWTQGSFTSMWRVPSSEPWYAAPGTLGLYTNVREGEGGRLAFSERFDIREGTTYEVSAWLASHRGSVSIWLDYFDTDDKWMGNSGGAVYPFDPQYDASAGNRWRFAVQRHAAPSGARSACLVLHSGGYTEGSDAWIWVNRPQVCVAGSSSYPALWSPGTTFIDGSQIKAGSITADRLSAAYLTVGTNVADLPGSLDKSRVVGDFSDRVTVIDGGKISTGTVSADKLTITTPNLVSNPELTGGSGWTHNGVVQAEQFGSGAPTRTALRWQQRDFNNVGGRQYFPDGATLTVAVSISGAAGNAFPLNIGMQFDNGKGEYRWVSGVTLPAGAIQPGRWQRFSVRVKAPAGFNFGYFWMNQEANEKFTELFVSGPGVTQGETYIDGGQITTGTLDANRVRVTNLKGENITSGTLDAAQVRITNLNASSISSGTLDASRVAVVNLSASNIRTGTLDVNQINIANLRAEAISGGTLDARWVNVTNLSASNLTSGTINAQQIGIVNLSASSITTGTLDANRVSVVNLNANSIRAGTLRSGNDTTFIDLDGGRARIGASGGNRIEWDGSNLLVQGNLRGVDSKFSGMSEASYFLIRRDPNTDLTQAQKDTRLYGLVTAAQVDGSLAAGDGAQVTPGGRYASFRVPIPTSSYKKIYGQGNISLRIRSGAGNGVGTYTLRLTYWQIINENGSQHSSRDVHTYYSFNAGVNLTNSIIIPFAFLTSGNLWAGDTDYVAVDIYLDNVQYNAPEVYVVGSTPSYTLTRTFAE